MRQAALHPPTLYLLRNEQRPGGRRARECRPQSGQSNAVDGSARCKAVAATSGTPGAPEANIPSRPERGSGAQAVDFMTPYALSGCA